MRFVGLLLAAAIPITFQTAAQTTQRAADWRQDINTLGLTFPKVQVDPWARLTEHEWRDGIAELKALPIDQMKDADVAVRIEHLLARYHDGHIRTMTEGTSSEAQYLPLRVRWFPQGIYVVDAELPELVGGRLLSIGDTAAEMLAARVAPWISVENESGLHAALFAALPNAAILAAAKIIPDGLAVKVRVRLSSGEQRTVRLVPQRLADIAWKGKARLPMYREPHTPANWMKQIPERGAIYLRYAECHDSTVAKQLAEELSRALNQAPLRVIVDLRGNEGGGSAIFAPLLGAIRRSGAGHNGRLDVLTDRYTFSSAFRNLEELRALDARQIGEAPGQRPVYTGNLKSFPLPHSRVQIRYSTKWSKLGPAEILEQRPEIDLQPTPEQFLAGQDPVLERALRGR